MQIGSNLTVYPRRDQPGGSSGCSTRRPTVLILAPQAIHRAIIRPHDQTAATHGRRARNRTPQGELRQLRVQLPAKHRLLKVEGDSLRTWELKSENGEDKDDVDEQEKYQPREAECRTGFEFERRPISVKAGYIIKQWLPV